MARKRYKPEEIVAKLRQMTSNACDAVQTIADGIRAWRSVEATLWLPLYLSCLALAQAQLGRFDDAWRCIGEATTIMDASGETWCEAEPHRVLGYPLQTLPRRAAST